MYFPNRCYCCRILDSLRDPSIRGNSQHIKLICQEIKLNSIILINISDNLTRGSVNYLSIHVMSSSKAKDSIFNTVYDKDARGIMGRKGYCRNNN